MGEHILSKSKRKRPAAILPHTKRKVPIRVKIGFIVSKGQGCTQALNKIKKSNSYLKKSSMKNWCEYFGDVKNWYQIVTFYAMKN